MKKYNNQGYPIDDFISCGKTHMFNFAIGRHSLNALHQDFNVSPLSQRDKHEKSRSKS